MQRHVYRRETVALTLEDIVRIVGEDPDSLLGSAIAVDEDHPIRELSAHVLGAEVSQEVAIEHGELAELTTGTYRLPVTWRATERAELFPVMTGELEFTALSNHPPSSEVYFLGHYTPPLGPLGGLGERMGGHRIAEQSVTRFLRDVCDRLEATVSA